ncbi:hypothetical protein BFF78_01535 [Streptomyces fodineus]|uniref:Uncharacterized protein n=1 Tax=Streptomyces fodineus TaxID=1904616 RepID=A0A1D7Y307_9ACTN|nr:hypothetical protein BFF78_01535 [Streptomyces fodineus]
MLEMSLHRAGYEHGYLYLVPKPGDIEGVLENVYDPTDDWRTPLPEYGEVVAVWVVQKGVLVDGIDLRSYLTGCQDGARRTFAEAAERNGTDEQSPMTGVQIDWVSIASALPALCEPVAGSDAGAEEPEDGYRFRLEGPRPLPGLDSYIDALLEDWAEDEEEDFAPGLDYGENVMH